MSIRCLRNTLAVAVAITWVGTAIADVRVVSPAIDETVHSNTGSVRVIVEGVPRGLQWQPVLDGAAVSEPVADPVFHLRDVTRGTHELTVKVIDARGREVLQTSPVTFHVWQASRLFRNRQR